MSRGNTVVFAFSATGLVAVVAAALTLVSSPPPGAALTTRPLVRRIAGARNPIPAPFVMFRTLAPRQAYGRVAMVSASPPESVRHVSTLSCARVHYAGGTGLCLVEEVAGESVKHVAYIFDRAFAPGRRVELTGVPIRARVSPDGRRAAITVYAEEESPAGERLASESIVVDLASGRVLADLREFSVTNANHPPIVGSIDIAGVAFAPDSDHFFATLSTASERYLVSGSVNAQQLNVVGTGVASEALSPGGQHLLVKKRVGDRGYWQLLVLELGTMRERALNQGSRSVDDQVEWLDDAHVVYHDATDEGTGIWMLSTDGISGPQLLVADAFSPAVQR